MLMLTIGLLMAIGLGGWFHHKALKRVERLENFIMALADPVVEVGTRNGGGLGKKEKEELRKVAEKEVTYKEMIRKGSASGKELRVVGREKRLV